MQIYNQILSEQAKAELILRAADLADILINDKLFGILLAQNENGIPKKKDDDQSR